MSTFLAPNFSPPGPEEVNLCRVGPDVLGDQDRTLETAGRWTGHLRETSRRRSVSLSVEGRPPFLVMELRDKSPVVGCGSSGLSYLLTKQLICMRPCPAEAFVRYALSLWH